MLKAFSLFITACIFFAVTLTAQDTLPGLTVKNFSGQIVVSWVNNYKAPISNITIQRSYDSLKNYTTIGAVLNPQNAENGYADATPPYNKMYYRIFVSFEGGNYLFSKIARPVKEVQETISNSNPFLYKEKMEPAGDRRQWKGNILPKSPLPPINGNTEIITYPSRRIFTNREYNIVIYLPDAPVKKYSVKFFNELNAPLFELNKLNEDFLIIEKVNFIHGGWYNFEVFENGKLIERNKFYISKDGKSPPPQK